MPLRPRIRVPESRRPVRQRQLPRKSRLPRSRGVKGSAEESTAVPIRQQSVTYCERAGAKPGLAIALTTEMVVGVRMRPHDFRRCAATTAAYHASGLPHLASSLLQHPRSTRHRRTLQPCDFDRCWCPVCEAYHGTADLTVPQRPYGRGPPDDPPDALLAATRASLLVRSAGLRIVR